MTTRSTESTAAAPTLFVAFELGDATWKLAFTTAPAQRPRLRSIPARDCGRVLMELADAKARFGLPRTARVISCYEAGRDGFWLHRFLTREAVENHVVDASSIEVNRRARRAKTDRLDATKLVMQLMRFVAGEQKVWSVVRVPSLAEEDQRQVHRMIETVRKDRGRLVSRITGLLATQGICLPVHQRFAERLAGARVWEGGPVPPGLQQRLLKTWEQWKILTRQLHAFTRLREQRTQDEVDAMGRQVQQLRRLRGIDESAWVFVSEAFGWRQFQNGREIGALTGLGPHAVCQGRAAPGAGHQQKRESPAARDGHPDRLGVVAVSVPERVGPVVPGTLCARRRSRAARGHCGRGTQAVDRAVALSAHRGRPGRSGVETGDRVNRLPVAVTTRRSRRERLAPGPGFSRRTDLTEGVARDRAGSRCAYGIGCGRQAAAPRIGGRRWSCIDGSVPARLSVIGAAGGIESPCGPPARAPLLGGGPARRTALRRDWRNRGLTTTALIGGGPAGCPQRSRFSRYTLLARIIHAHRGG
jgi:transposase